MDLNDSKEMVGFQNSQFNLKKIEANLARLGRIHLILEHLITIKVNLNLENGRLHIEYTITFFFLSLKKSDSFNMCRLFRSFYNIFGWSP